MKFENRQSKFFLTAAVLTALGIAAFGAAGAGADFRVYYDGALNLRVRGWPAVYDPTAWTPFKYHPVVVLCFLPFTFLPFAVANGLWALLNFGMLWDIRRVAARRWGIGDWPLFIGALFTVHALTWEIKLGNITLWMLWVFVRSVASDSPWAQAGGWGTLVLLKPTWLVVYPVLLFVRRQKAVVYSAGVFLAASLVVLLFFGKEPFSYWYATLSDPLHAHNYPKNDNQSWMGLCYRWKNEIPVTAFWLAGSAAFFGAFAALSWRARDRASEILLASPLLWLWISPLTWIHHELLLIPFFAAYVSKSYIWEPHVSKQGLSFSRLSSLGLALVWIFLNGTGELFLQRSGFVWAHQAGLPLLGYVFALCLLPTYYGKQR